jgi:predicted dehydrogenase
MLALSEIPSWGERLVEVVQSGRRLRAGIVGGGRGAFIGAVHRIAAELDARSLVVAGALSADPAVARASAQAWGLQRSYDSFEAMARAEAAHDDGVEFVIVATPNHLHLPVARAFLERGIHVICDKPLALNVAEGEELERLVGKGPPLFALTHPYSAYPAIRQARDMVAAGQLGTLRKVLVEYVQDWLMEPLESRGNKQAEWRSDPARAGAGGCIGDIGTHAAHLLEFVTGGKIATLCADLSTFIGGRLLDDDANMLLRMDNGAKGTLVCSQVACGEDNHIRLRLYGSKGALEWQQLEANTLVFKAAGGPWQVLRTGGAYMGADARAGTRVPGGHPEGYLEAFANIYREFIEDIQRLQAGDSARRNYPGVHEGVRGLRFIAAANASSSSGSRWTSL